ncbi:hypothetical protein EV643_10414 [Kribbella sp. VKM Ac-2527]|uniref:Xaa-Pro dipeptidyl-peptidase C-terminal domain-containing protein n=1 Tax=Kribbella caucasensis TaxID=2512215 RepID=A0A4R6KJ87_9ACTN|nr:CocE/NonD family hydrolase [Kribbella sp. VKM Ac-2527]TDO50522.1 hypothetical protein EV643_10414 [Kribbella sp. VKM Ac-2527]
MVSPSTALLQRRGVRVLRDLRIPSVEGDWTLSADLYLPSETPRPLPTVILLTPYRKELSMGTESEPYCSWFAAQGYASLIVEFAGTGVSDGPTRPAFVPDEAYDGVSAVEWAARQPWSNGNVALWGISYGGILALRTAALRPPALKAIVPLMAMADPGRDFIRPDGAAAGLAPVVWWGTGRLADQLMPPLQDFQSARQQERWRSRLDTAALVPLELFRAAADDSALETLKIDLSKVSVPTLSIAGWRDIQWNPQVVAFEQLSGPKTLIVGPWMHVVPNGSPFERTDFLLIAEHWLRPILEDGQAVEQGDCVLYQTGDEQGWQRFHNWPAADAKVHLSGTRAGTLVPGVVDQPYRGATRRDCTVGSHSGLWGIGSATFGLPIEQSADDVRSITLETDPLEEALTISGRVEVALGNNTPPPRLVVRLTEIDELNRSTLIAMGTSVGSNNVTLYPILHRVPSGRRLRVAVSDSDFPRLWPALETDPLEIQGISIEIPTASPALSEPAALPMLDEIDEIALALAIGTTPTWRITRDAIQDGIEVVVGSESTYLTADGGHEVFRSRQQTATVRNGHPEGTRMSSIDTQRVRLQSGETIDVKVTALMTSDSLWLSGEVRIDDEIAFAERWRGSTPGSSREVATQ